MKIFQKYSHDCIHMHILFLFVIINKAIIQLINDEHFEFFFLSIKVLKNIFSRPEKWIWIIVIFFSLNATSFSVAFV